ncbi:MAG: hypothetical protein B1H04_00710, partial [Planctomycetales bacterium 4484_123]
QTLRVVDYLEHPYPHFRGLNLTHAVRRCLAKHQSRYDSPAGGEFDDGLQAPLEGQRSSTTACKRPWKANWWTWPTR